MAVEPKTTSWRRKLRTPTPESHGISTELTPPKSDVHARVITILEQLSTGNVVKVGIPGEEQLRAFLLKKARNQVDNISEEDLVRYIGMLSAVCQGAINGGEQWERVIGNSDPDTESGNGTDPEAEPIQS